MTEEPAPEIEILNRPRLTVTDRCIKCDLGEIPIEAVSAPEITPAAKPSTPSWIARLIDTAFSGFLRTRRPALEISISAQGARRTVYTTSSEQDAQLAFAAITEAMRRRAS